MLFDDIPVKKPEKEFPRRLDTLSITELQDYIIELKDEIARVEQDIEKKRASQAAAASFFKT